MSTAARVYSFEFFPPKTEEGILKLKATCQQLAQLKPRFFSVTFGAGGSTQERTLETVLDIQRQQLQAAPHLSCIGSTKENIRAILSQYRTHQVRHIVALRGDMPSGMREAGAFRYANELVEFIRREQGDYFYLEVAAYPEVHPQAENAHQDLIHFKQKVDAGANSAITQYFYNPDSYFYFVEACHKMGICIPIVPGIMPITQYAQLARFSDLCGAEIPRWLLKRLEAYADDRESLRAFGIEVVTRMCQILLDGGCPGLHFYTMNQAEPTQTIWQNLGLGPGN